MKNLATNFLLGIALLSACSRTTDLRAGENPGHHRSGIIGQAVVTLNATVTLNDGPLLGEPLWPIECTVKVYRMPDWSLKDWDSKPKTFDVELVAEVPTDAEGYFEVALKPGTYFLLPQAPPPPPGPIAIVGTISPLPSFVTVTRKQYTSTYAAFLFSFF